MVERTAIDIPCPRCKVKAGTWCVDGTTGKRYTIDHKPVLHRVRRLKFEEER